MREIDILEGVWRKLRNLRGVLEEIQDAWAEIPANT